MEINLNDPQKPEALPLSQTQQATVQSISTQPVEIAPVQAQAEVLPLGLKPNPNRVVERTVEPVQPVQQSVTHAVSSIAASARDENTVKDLSDMLSGFPRIRVNSRLLVKYVINDSELEGLREVALTDIENVTTSGDKVFNFYSPFKNGSNDAPNGFFRKPLIQAIRYLNSNNAESFILFAPAQTQIEQFISELDKSVMKVIYSDNFGSNDIVAAFEDEDAVEAAQEMDDEDEGMETEDTNTYKYVSDFFSIDSWASYSFDEFGICNVNYTVSISIQALELYDSKVPEKTIARAKKFISGVVENFEASTLTVGFAVVVDNKMIASPAVIDIIDILMPHEESEEYQFLTYSEVEKIVEEKEEALISLEDASFDLWDEESEFFPTSKADISKLLKPTELMFMTIVAKHMDSEEEDSEEEVSE